MEGYLSTNEAAGVLDCDAAYVRRLLRTGKIAGRKLGRDWWADKTSVEAYRRTEHKPGPVPASTAKRKST